MVIKSLIAICILSGQAYAASSWPQSAQSNPPHLPAKSPANQSLDAIYAELASRRQLQINRLHAYAAKGQFPQNTDFPGRLVPYFVDHEGTACAVGQLMRLDGQSPLVNQIAARSNHIRIEDVFEGPLVNWIRNSGLTLAECALIQPSYSCIEDYRKGREWTNEQARLRDHFARVEKTLQFQSQRSLGEALIAKLAADQEATPSELISTVPVLARALSSPERNVRIAAAHLLAKMPFEKSPPNERIELLKPRLSDPDVEVRFWSAVAIEQIAFRPSRYFNAALGDTETHLLTLPVFLGTFRSDQDELRLPALVEMANIAPESISSNVQLRIVPDVRRAIVEAAHDQNSEVSKTAQQILASWRWQRIVYESKRMRRHYLAASAPLESLAAETKLLGRKFAIQPSFDSRLAALKSSDMPVSVSCLEVRPPADHWAIARTENEASELVDEFLRNTYAQIPEAADRPQWQTRHAIEDRDGIFFAVAIIYHNSQQGQFYLVPGSTALATANRSPYQWLKTQYGPPANLWPASPPPILRPVPDLDVVLGSVARSDPQTFANACDFFVSSMSPIVVDRHVRETPDTLTWSASLADLRVGRPRFLEQGGGGFHSNGGGGWDFNRLTMTCDRATGKLSLAVDPIAFPIEQLPPEVLSPPWMLDELKLMGWKPLPSPDFFGDRLLPPEYHQLVAEFDPSITDLSRDRTRAKFYRTWLHDKSLPPPNLMLALLYERAGNHDAALRSIRNLSGDVSRDPAALADIARWELSIGQRESAQKHAEAALKLWPNHPASSEVLKQLTDPNAIAN